MLCHQYDAILLAAGSGKRFDANHAKQYAKIHDKTILQYSLEVLLSLPNLNFIVIVLSKEDTEFQQLNLHHPKIQTIVGGRERADSVLNALSYLSVQKKSADWVLVHDAARCCVRKQAIMNLIEQCLDKNTGGLLVSPVKDTIKQRSLNNKVTTIPRSNLFIAQTPQFFQTKNLLNAYQFSLANNITPTDEASAIEQIAEDILLVAGDQDNLKITTPIDKLIAEKILEKKE